MYPKNTLIRYGNALKDAGEKERFLALIPTLEAVVRQGTFVVMTGELYDALESNSLERLKEDLNNRWLEFTEADDIVATCRN